jgi:hypothetical protein
MQHYYTYPTVTPLPRDRRPAHSHEAEADGRPSWPDADQPNPGGAGPRRYSSASSGGSESTAS